MEATYYVVTTYAFLAVFVVLAYAAGRYGVEAYIVLAVFVVLAYAAGRCYAIRRPTHPHVYCRICGVWCYDTEHLEEHKKGRLHLKKKRNSEISGLVW